MMTLSKPKRSASSVCSKVSTEPQISGCPNLFPKSEAPLEALIKISMGVWYSHGRALNPFSQGRLFNKRE